MKDKKGEINSFYPLFGTAVFILVLILYPFSDIEAFFYDLWIKFHVKKSTESRFVIISQDETNDQILGEYYPYTYATHSKFIEKVTEDSPFAITYFLNFDDPTLEDDEKYYKKFIEKLEHYVDGGGHFKFGTSLSFWGEQVPPEKLKKFGYLPALINVDGESFAKDSVNRKAVLNISGENTVHLWLSNKMRESDQKEEITAKFLWGAFYDSDADATFVNYRHLINLNKFEEDLIVIPFYRVLNGDIPPGFFKDKVVLVGPQYSSNLDDFVLTPFSKENKISKLALHASIVHSLYFGKTLYPLPDLISDVIALVLAIMLSFVISKVRPTKGLVLTMVLIMSVILVSYISFVFLGVWIKIAHIILSIFIVYYIWIPFRAIAEYQTRFAVEEEANMLKQVENLKQNFISLMSHDLKTPVAKIAGMADLLKLKLKGQNEPLRVVQDITLATKELNQFISSILDLIKVESQDLKLKLASKDINKIISDVVEKLSFEAESKKIEIETELSPLYPIEVDQNLVHRVISNLVENALKYSEAKSEISIKTHDNDEWVFVEIKDTGPGIKEKDLEHIFKKFYRVKNDSTHKIKGSGLGLYLVKYFVELHEGEISVNSEIGKGTTFTIKFINK